MPDCVPITHGTPSSRAAIAPWLTSDPMSTTTFNGLRLRSIGPAFTSGRINGFAVDPNNPLADVEYLAGGGCAHTFSGSGSGGGGATETLPGWLK